MTHCKIVLLAVLMFFVNSQTSAQIFENFSAKIDGHIGAVSPLGKDYPVKGGFAATLEPKFWYNDELVFGFKLSSNFLQSQTSKVKLAPLNNIHLVGEKYFELNSTNLIPFVGASGGLYTGGQIRKIDGAKTGAKGQNYLGYAIRGGGQLGQLRLLAEYHRSKNKLNFLTFMLGYQL
jgi:hypothetical protein